MTDMSIKTRLWLSSTLSALLVLSIWVAMYVMATTMSEMQALVSTELAKAEMLQDVAALLQVANAPGNDVLASWDFRTERKNLEVYKDAFELKERELVLLIAGDQELAVGYESTRADVRVMMERASMVMDQAERKETAEKAGDLEAANTAAKAAAARMAQMDQSNSLAAQQYRRLDGIQRARIAVILTDTADFNRSAVGGAFGLLVVTIALTIGVALVLVRSITVPVGQALRIAERIAQGDLRENATIARDDEVGKLLQAMGYMAGNLRGLMGNLRSGAAQLSTSSSQIGATASELASTAAEQSASIAQISTTVEEIKQMSQAAATAARDVAEASDKAATQGRVGRERLDSAVITMQAINERVSGIAGQILQLADQTSQIGTIVESVNDLAEQSNLLAVNASIEAAKAGEHGRGFAVVAAEVRSLAEQSKRATRQIRSILVDIQKATQSAVMATEEGTKRADDGRRAIEALRDVVDTLAGTLEDTSGKGRQIAGAAIQQAAGISEISAAMNGISKAGQDNAKGVRQLDQAVRDLGRLAAELKSNSDKFQV